jgi:hypothetical protein
MTPEEVVGAVKAEVRAPLRAVTALVSLNGQSISQPPKAPS